MHVPTQARPAAAAQSAPAAGLGTVASSTAAALSPLSACPETLTVETTVAALRRPYAPARRISSLAAVRRRALRSVL